MKKFKEMNKENQLKEIRRIEKENKNKMIEMIDIFKSGFSSQEEVNKYIFNQNKGV